VGIVEEFLKKEKKMLDLQENALLRVELKEKLGIDLIERYNGL